MKNLLIIILLFLFGCKSNIIIPSINDISEETIISDTLKNFNPSEYDTCVLNDESMSIIIWIVDTSADFHSDSCAKGFCEKRIDTISIGTTCCYNLPSDWHIIVTVLPPSFE